jgi:hypothetical protein
MVSVRARLWLVVGFLLAAGLLVHAPTSNLVGFAVEGSSLGGYSEPRSGFVVDDRVWVVDTVVYDTGYYSYDGVDWTSFGFREEEFSGWVFEEASTSGVPVDARYYAVFSCSWSDGWDCEDTWQVLDRGSQEGFSGQFLTDFSDGFSGWSVLGSADAEVVSSSQTGGSSLRVDKSSGRLALVWDSVPVSRSYEVFFRARASSSGAELFALGSLVGDDVSSLSALVSGVNLDPTSELLVRNYVGGSWSNLVVEGVSARPGDWHLVRVRVDYDSSSGESLVRLRHWLGSLSDEPGSWQVQATSSSVGLGSLGLFFFRDGVYEVDFVGVGVGGASAPAPSSPSFVDDSPSNPPPEEDPPEEQPPTEEPIIDDPAGSWRSSLYPANWEPGYVNEHGEFLHDFSYAGYHRGEKSIPNNPPGVFLDVTASPYNADPSGSSDSTSAIQKALDDAGQAGGGVVYLPQGVYRVQKPSSSSEYVLSMRYSNVVLRGAGVSETFIFNDDYEMNRRKVILIQPSPRASWSSGSSTRSLAEDIANGASEVFVGSTSGLSVGDWIILASDMTQEFVDELDARHVDEWVDSIVGMRFLRQITAIDSSSGRVEFDAPVRYSLKVRDNARLFKPSTHLEEVGLEDFSIGNREHPGDVNSDEHNIAGTAANDIAGSYVVLFQHVVNGWVRNVESYLPESNRRNHMLSNGLFLSQTRGITVENSRFLAPQLISGGGNGYGIRIECNECLFTRSGGLGRAARYTFSHARTYASGNVIHRSVSGSIRSDFHMHLSPPNLVDNLEVHRYFMAANRGSTGSIPHAVTTQDSVFWNTRGLGSGSSNSLTPNREVITVRGQSNRLFVIGTSGDRTEVFGIEPEYAHRYEGLGEGDSLVPESLYEDQVLRRIGVCRVCE